MKKSVLLPAIIGVLGLGAALYLLFTGPRMKVQPNIRAYQAAMPLHPVGTVAIVQREALPADDAVNPYPASKENISRGAAYYGYYCLQCHGAAGDGKGPVGQSFSPTPTDLRSEKISNMSDGRIVRAMLTGPGHKPAVSGEDFPSVLEYTVLPEHRWYLALYVRSLSTKR